MSGDDAFVVAVLKITDIIAIGEEGSAPEEGAQIRPAGAEKVAGG